MDPTIISAAAALAGTTVGAAATIYAGRRHDEVSRLKHENENLNRKYLDACRQISGFHKIEETLSEEWAKVAGLTANQAKLRGRAIAEEKGAIRPDWSALEAQREIDRLS